MLATHISDLPSPRKQCSLSSRLKARKNSHSTIQPTAIKARNFSPELRTTASINFDFRKHAFVQALANKQYPHYLIVSQRLLQCSVQLASGLDCFR
jgi:hypothetical protein